MKTGVVFRETEKRKNLYTGKKYKAGVLIYEIKCDYDGTIFTSRRSNAKFCSASCKTLYHRALKKIAVTESTQAKSK